MSRIVATLLRSIGHPISGSAPAAPTGLSVVNDGDGDAVTATVTGTAGATYVLQYCKAGAVGWTNGQSRSGSGDIAQTGMDDDTVYTFQIVGKSGDVYSKAYGPATVHVKNTSAAEEPSDIFTKPVEKLRKTLAASATFQTLAGEASAAATLRHIHYFGINVPGGWEATAAVTLGMMIRVESASQRELVFECTVSGTTGGSEPTWPTVVGGTVNDGGVTWTARAAYGDPLLGAARAARPYALVGIGEKFTFNEVAVYQFASAGSLVLYIEADTPSEHADTIDRAGRWFANRVGAILNEMDDLAGQPGSDYLNIRGFSLIDFARTLPKDHKVEGDRFHVMFAVEWEGA